MAVGPGEIAANAATKVSKNAFKIAVSRLHIVVQALTFELLILIALLQDGRHHGGRTRRMALVY